MPEGCSKISYIVQLRHRLRRWRKKAAEATTRRLLSDVPSGHIAITVGSSCKRYVVPATHLNHPLFQKLLLQAEEEYGFTNSGPLAIPCGEGVFEEILECLDRTESYNHVLSRLVSLNEFQRCSDMDNQKNLGFFAYSSPLFHTPKSVW